MAGKRLKWRAGIRSFHRESPIKQFLQATGSSAGQPLDRGCCQRSGSGCCLWPLDVGQGRLGLAARSSGRTGLLDKRSCLEAGGPVGPRSRVHAKFR
jgi:hypothetical protein